MITNKIQKQTTKELLGVFLVLEYRWSAKGRKAAGNGIGKRARKKVKIELEIMVK